MAWTLLLELMAPQFLKPYDKTNKNDVRFAQAPIRSDPISALPAGCTSTNEVLCLQWLLPFSARCFPDPWRGIGWSRRIKI
jgi:hypothetical protein